MSDDPIDGIPDRSGKALAVRDVALAATGNRGDPLDRELEVRAWSLDVDAIGFRHEASQRIHGRLHGLVIQKTNTKIKVLKCFSTHPRLLSHCRMRPTQHAPFGFLHPMPKNFTGMPLSKIRPPGRHIAAFRYVVTPADRDVGIHIPHFGHPVLGEQTILLVRSSHEKLPGNPHRIHRHKRNRSSATGLPDQGDAHILWNIIEIYQNFLAPPQPGRVTNELLCEPINPGVVHVC